MKNLFLFFFLLIASVAHSQKVLKGVVQNAETGAPVPAASVFLNNTSVGTTASADGRFTLSVPAGRYDLIVSSVGFETFTRTISSNTEEALITIKLQPKAKELQTVVVAPFEKDGWQKWGKFFVESFIGLSAHAKDCDIKNSHVIKFRHDKKNNELSVVALEPLIIENRALGYTITYQLEHFSFSFKNNYLLYVGYPYFQPMKGGAARQRQWAARRQQVYEGSMMHFMRSLYRNNLAAEGFQVQRLKKIPNIEKERVKAAKALYTQRSYNSSGALIITDNTPGDSAAYFSRIMAQPDHFDVAAKTPVPGDSIAYAVNPTTAGLGFEDYLLITYLKKEAPQEYTSMFPKNGTSMTSQITLMNGRDIEVQANGSYYNPMDLLNLGYWAWSEKNATVLPYDYQPPLQKGK